jgi:hypothetical protein
VYGLSGHLGCWGGSHRFSVAYDLATGSQTAIDKRWLRCFQGQVALTPRAIEKLATAFPTYPVQRMYRDGPGGLWQAIWGELGNFRHGVLADDLAAFGDFGHATHEFEADTLLMDAYGLLDPELTVGHLAKAVAYSRLQSDMLGLDPSGMAQVVCRCLDSLRTQTELGMYDALDDVYSALKLLISKAESTSSESRWEVMALRLAWVSRD